MNDNKESIKSCIESSECLLYKRCKQLRELIFMNDDYDPTLAMNIAKDIKLAADIIIAQASKLNNTT